jgi:hypothetical protein
MNLFHTKTKTMRAILLLIFFFFSLVVFAQKKYRAEYKANVSFKLPDSTIKSMRLQTITSMRLQLKEKGLSEELADQLVNQMLGNSIISKDYRTIINAGPDSTFILDTQDTEEGTDIKMNMQDPKQLFRKGELYRFDSAHNCFFSKPDTVKNRKFIPKGKGKKIKGYLCNGYISSDGACKIWVAPSLPFYINPGIKTGKIKGAVLGYELREKGHTVESEIDKLEALSQ